MSKSGRGEQVQVLLMCHRIPVSNSVFLSTWTWLHSEAGSLQVVFSGGSRLVTFTSSTSGGGGSVFPTRILSLSLLGLKRMSEVGHFHLSTERWFPKLELEFA